ncbi:MAG TPA: ABC transporter substrate-binding protein [Ktedonobacterales bacterium]|jgi:ABC-type transport system substrate-binding protein/tRNA A-37 threonylcarbamoyl transferase component Bud32
MSEYQGQQLGYYRVIRFLGEGGYAQVFLGEHVFLKTQAAIKVLTTRLAQEEMENFLREAQTIARLRHPNIVRVLDFGVQDGTPFLVMDYAPHGTLRQRHPRGVQLPLEVVLPYVQQIAEALQYAHEEKLIHRDIKPENMLIGLRDEILLSDFGIATVAQSSRYEGQQDIAGTIAYMAPEQVQGQPRPASDLYSLGVVVYEWLSGDRPFQGTFTEVVVQHAVKPPPPMRAKVPMLSPKVEQVIMTALEKDPNDRFTNARTFARALEEASLVSELPLPRFSNLPSLEAMSFPQSSNSLEILRPSAPFEPTPIPSTVQTDYETRPYRAPAGTPSSARIPPPSAREAVPPTPAKRRNRMVAVVSLILAQLIVLSGLGAAGYFFLLKSGGTKPGPMTIRRYPYNVPTHKGGTIVYGSPYFIESTNPWFAGYAEDFDLIDALWGSPLVIGPSGTYLPDQLAEIPTQANGDVSKDGLTVVLKLRHDLRWSDGQPLTADDFVYWLEVEQDPRTGVISSNGFDGLANYRARDPYALLLTYKRPFAPYLAYLPFAAPRHVWGKVQHPDLASRQDVTLTPGVTSGPFMLANYSGENGISGPRFLMVPNPYYVSTTLHASVLDQLIFQGYNDVASAVAAYQGGEIDQIENLQPGDLPGVKRLQGLRISPTIGYTHLDFNLTKPALQDANVRKAIEESIDRCQIIKVAFSQPCNSLRVDTILPKPSPDFDPTNQTYSFDLAQAKKDMQIAGWDCSGRTCTQNRQPFPTLNLVTYTGNPYDAIARLMKQDLEALGLSVSLQGFDSHTIFANFTRGGVLATGKYDLAVFGYNFTLDSDVNLYPSFHSSEIPSAEHPTGQNYERVNDVGVDELLDEGRTTLGSAERSQIYKDVQRILVQKVYVIPLYLEPNIVLTSSIIGNYFTNPTLLGNAWNIGDWYRTR